MASGHSVKVVKIIKGRSSPKIAPAKRRNLSSLLLTVYIEEHKNVINQYLEYMKFTIFWILKI